ncbi:MAG: BON domain-containing protein [Planctomycetes bacterium]|nr:BON domain-containing protein [Planctomycetota bacterium]
MQRTILGLAIAAMLAVAAPPTHAATPDQQKAQQLAHVLKASGKMARYRVGVKYQNGTVWLQGQVISAQQKAMAEALISQTPGVKQVVNQLAITAPAPAPLTIAAQSPAAQRPNRSSAVFARPAIGRPTRATRIATKTSARRTSPLPVSYVAAAPAAMMAAPLALGQAAAGRPIPAYVRSAGAMAQPARYDRPHLPNYAWPSYAAHPNYAAVTYPKQYSPTAWPYIGPFYPYPQVPLGWRKVTLEWDDGWWQLDFKNR